MVAVGSAMVGVMMATGLDQADLAVTPGDSQELAYQLWAFVCGRNAADVARRLASGEYGPPTVVPERTIRYWSASGDWSARAKQELAAIAPDLRDTIVSEVVYAALDGARYLRRVAGGLEDTPDCSDVTKPDGADDADWLKQRDSIIAARVKGHALARRDRLQASLGALDRFGVSPQSPAVPSPDAMTAGKRTSLPAGKLSEADRQAIAARLASMLDGSDPGDDSGGSAAPAVASR